MATIHIVPALFFVLLGLADSSGALGTSSDLTFGEFIQAHGRAYRPGTAEYDERARLFEQSKLFVARQNGLPGRLWAAKLNRLADQTTEDLAALRGYDRNARPEAGSSAHLQFLGKDGATRRLPDLPSDFSWKPHLKAMQEVQDQSTCGSCWAFSASTVLRAHAELYQQDRKFSVQELISCTPNERECGGKGGCDGATVELAMDYVVKNSCVTASEWPYAADVARGDGEKCRRLAAATAAASSALVQKSFMSPSRGVWGGHAGHRHGILGYRKLPENKYEPLMFALYDSGPVGISIAAGYRWNFYDSGIMEACDRDAVVDHAVVLVGFGVDKGTKYWTIQNSWGDSWGEAGFIRLERLGDQENAHCGWDNQPEIGSGCKGGPSRVRICGSCGILYDAVVPEFAISEQGFMVKSGRRPVPNATEALLLGRGIHLGRSHGLLAGVL